MYRFIKNRSPNFWLGLGLCALIAVIILATSPARAQPPNNVFVVDDTIDFVLWNPQAINPALFIIVDIELRREIARWLNNDMPLIYVSGVGEYYVGSVCMSKDRVVITLGKL